MTSDGCVERFSALPEPSNPVPHRLRGRARLGCRDCADTPRQAFLYRVEQAIESRRAATVQQKVGSRGTGDRRGLPLWRRILSGSTQYLPHGSWAKVRWVVPAGIEGDGLDINGSAMCTDIEPRVDMFRVGGMTQPNRSLRPGDDHPRQSGLRVSHPIFPEETHQKLPSI